MVRLFQLCVGAIALATALLISTTAFAQSPLATPTPNASSVPTGTITSTARTNNISATATVTIPMVTITTEASPTIPSAQSNAPLTASVNSASAPLEGTILANRSESLARFFLEGNMIQLEAGRSQSIAMPRSTTVLNLFNCSGELPDSTEECFWDPYLIQQNGFYEIFNDAPDGETVQLMLREAGPPPTGQVWVQNRTGQSESVVFKEDVFEIPPTSVQSFPVASGVPAILYVRSCLTVDGQSACEWAPKTLDAGIYYAMVEVDTPGSQSGTTQSTIDLQPVVGDVESQEVQQPVAAAAPLTIVCNVVVPALNVRSGPGLQYDIIGKVRTTDGSAVMVNVTGRSADNEWLTVEPSIAQGGWINNSPSFISCSGDLLSLPIIDTPATPTPLPVVVSEQPATGEAQATTPDSTQGTAPVIAEQPTAAVETPVEDAPTVEVPAVPAGQAMLVVNNGFQHEMRFTLDQMYRVVEGPSEFDLQPGQSMSILVFPGDIPFTASSPWSGLSGNASIHAEPDQSIPLWLRFDPEQEGTWVLRWN